MSKLGNGIIASLVALLSICIISGIVYAFIHPAPPDTAEDAFRKSCEYQEGVPDTHSSPWRCLK